MGGVQYLTVGSIRLFIYCSLYHRDTAIHIRIEKRGHSSAFYCSQHRHTNSTITIDLTAFRLK